MAERSVSVKLSAVVEPYKRAMADAAASTKQFEDKAGVNFQKVGAQMQSVGRTMTTHVTLPLVGLGVGAVKLSSDFNTAFSQMVGLAGVPAGEVDQLRESVLALAGETARSPQELAEALYFAASAGLDTAQAMDAVTIAAQASKVGLGSTQDIVGLAASAIASYGAENITAAEATDILVSTIREGRAEPAELASTLGRVLPIASQLGVSFDEVGGTVAYLSNVFGDTNRTVTATQGLLVKLVSPSQQGRDALKEMGTSAEELQAAVDSDGLLGALELLKSRGFDTNAQALRALFDDIEGYQAATALLGADQETLAGIFEATADSTGSLQEALQAVDHDSQSLKQAWVDVQVALIQAGDIILPIVAGVAGAVGDLAQKFGALPGPVQTAVVGSLAFVAAIGPMLSIGGKLVSNLGAIRTGLVLLRTAMVTHPLLAFAAVAGTVAGALFMMRDSAGSASGSVDDLANSMINAADPAEGLANWILESSGAADEWQRIMDHAGVTVTEVAEAALAGGDAWKQMKSRLDDSNEATAESIKAQLNMTQRLDEFAGKAEEANEKMEQRARVDDRAATEADKATGAFGKLEGGLDDLTDSTTEADEATQDLIDTIFDAISRTFDYESATLSLEDANARLAERYWEYIEVMDDAKSSDEDKAAAARALREAEIATAEQALATAEAYAREMGAADGSANSARLQKEKLLELADQYPGLRDEISQYIARLNQIPPEKNTTITADTGPARAAVNGYIASLFGLKVPPIPFSIAAPGNAYTGGPVKAGRLYEVGEHNVAEMFVSGGRQYMIPGNDGNVIPGSQLTAAASSGAVFPSSLTLIIEGQPVSAIIARRDAELLAGLKAGVRG